MSKFTHTHSPYSRKLAETQNSHFVQNPNISLCPESEQNFWNNWKQQNDIIEVLCFEMLDVVHFDFIVGILLYYILL